MVMIRKFWVSVKFWGTYAILNPVRGRYMIVVAAGLVRVGQQIMEKGLSMALYFDGYLEGGIAKWAHNHGRHPEWLHRAAEHVERARALDEKLNPRPPEPKPLSRDLLRGLTLAAGEKLPDLVKPVSKGKSKGRGKSKPSKRGKRGK